MRQERVRRAEKAFWGYKLWGTKTEEERRWTAFIVKDGWEEMLSHLSSMLLHILCLMMVTNNSVSSFPAGDEVLLLFLIIILKLSPPFISDSLLCKKFAFQDEKKVIGNKGVLRIKEWPEQWTQKGGKLWTVQKRRAKDSYDMKHWKSFPFSGSSLFLSRVLKVREVGKRGWKEATNRKMMSLQTWTTEDNFKFLL